jgi:hypothetical protein
LDEGFNPDNITITVGDTVTWTVKSSIAHTMEPGDDAGGTCAENISHTFSGNGETSRIRLPSQSLVTILVVFMVGMNGVVNVKAKGDGADHDNNPENERKSYIYVGGPNTNVYHTIKNMDSEKIAGHSSEASKTSNPLVPKLVDSTNPAI